MGLQAAKRIIRAALNPLLNRCAKCYPPRIRLVPIRQSQYRHVPSLGLYKDVPQFKNNHAKQGTRQMTDMQDLPKLPFRMAAVSGKKPLHFNFVPDAAARALIAQSLALLDLPEFAFKGSLAPESRGDVGLSAKMTAVVVQPCAITLAPVRSRLGDDCERR